LPGNRSSDMEVEHKTQSVFFWEIPEDSRNTRLDRFLSSRPVSLSRSRIQALIKGENVKVNGGPAKASYRLRQGDRVSLSVPPPVKHELRPETVDFEIIHEDASLLVINKPSGLVVHPAPGHPTGTLVHGLLKHCKDLSGIGGVLRPGVVHRLDKDTSGLLVVAKNDRVHSHLSRQFKSGEVKKQYTTLVCGLVKGKRGKIDLPLARHPKKRKEIAVALSGGKRALTLWEKTREFQGGFTLLSVILKTGRTHQIRVHLSHMGHPIAGDPVYGYGRNWWKRHPLVRKGILPPIGRQMLHSRLLGFVHPALNRYLEFEAPLARDMERVLNSLKSAGRVKQDHKPKSTV
jgi:23S rRNA pseudouridine1911/1915/1917 synthase